MSTSQWSIQDLTPHPEQGAIYGDLPEHELRALADNIEQYGLQEPIFITPDGLILDGHQRVRAYELLGRSTIPVTIVQGASEHDHTERFIRANLDRRQLDPLAKARAIKALAELEQRRNGKSDRIDGHQEFRQRLAQQLGNISGRTLDRYLRLLTLPRPIQDVVSRGTLTMTKALKVASLAKSLQEEIAGRISAGQDPKSVTQTYLRDSAPPHTFSKETAADNYQRLIDLFQEFGEDLLANADQLAGTAFHVKVVAQLLAVLLHVAQLPN